MIGLAIHTSSPELGLALAELDSVATPTVRHQVWPLGRDLTVYLHTCLMDFIRPYTWTDLAFLAVAKGPGGFTGTRIGVTVARTLAQELSIPLFGISSLAAIAQQFCHTTSADIVYPPYLAVTLRAQREEIFGAIYQRTTAALTPAFPEAIHSQSDWETHLDSWPHPYHLITAEGGIAASVTGVLALALQHWHDDDRPDWHSVLPFYGQHPVHR